MSDNKEALPVVAWARRTPGGQQIWFTRERPIGDDWAAIADLRAQLQQQALRALSSEGEWIEMTGRMQDEIDRLKADPFGFFVYVPAEQRGEFVHNLDEAIDDLTNCECEVTPLYAGSGAPGGAG